MRKGWLIAGSFIVIIGAVLLFLLSTTQSCVSGGLGSLGVQVCQTESSTTGYFLGGPLLLIGIIFLGLGARGTKQTTPQKVVQPILQDMKVSGSSTGTEDIKYCQNCGAKMTRTGTFCPGCGSRQTS